MNAFFLIFVGLISQAAPAEPTPAGGKNAPQLVRQANELLLGDKPAEALQTYEQAQSLKPDAREIAFDQGLAHYRLGDFEKAREAFTRAAGGVADELADDAFYGLGTCDHAEAMAAEDPKEAVSKIESAMRNYQNVLGNRREHAAARDANLKAASYWRQLKQQMQEQQQQQQNQDPGDQEQNDEEKQEQEQQNPRKDQQQSDQNKQEQPESQDRQDQQKEQQQQQQEQEQEAAEQKEQPREQEQSAQEEEEASRDQAERKLREMVQAMRDRKKHRREEVKAPTHQPTEKDW